MHHSSIRSALAHAFQIPSRPALRSAATNPPVASSSIVPAARLYDCQKSSFSTTSTQNARQKGGGRPDRRISKPIFIPSGISSSQRRGALRSVALDARERLVFCVLILLKKIHALTLPPPSFTSLLPAPSDYPDSPTAALLPKPTPSALDDHARVESVPP
jgi:hypothetical protein